MAAAQLAFCRASSLAGPPPDGPSAPSPPARPPARSAEGSLCLCVSSPSRPAFFQAATSPSSHHGTRLSVPAQSFRPLECELPTAQGASNTKLCPKPLLDKYFINTDWHPPSVMARGLQGRSPPRWCSQKSGKKDVSYSQRSWQTSFIQY